MIGNRVWPNRNDSAIHRFIVGYVVKLVAICLMYYLWWTVFRAWPKYQTNEYRLISIHCGFARNTQTLSIIEWNGTWKAPKTNVEFFNPFVYTTKSSNVADIFVACYSARKSAQPFYALQKQNTHTHTFFSPIAPCILFRSLCAITCSPKTSHCNAKHNKTCTKHGTTQPANLPLRDIFVVSARKEHGSPVHSILEEIQCALCLRWVRFVGIFLFSFICLPLSLSTPPFFLQ